MSTVSRKTALTLVASTVVGLIASGILLGVRAWTKGTRVVSFSRPIPFEGGLWEFCSTQNNKETCGDSPGGTPPWLVVCRAAMLTSAGCMVVNSLLMFVILSQRVQRISIQRALQLAITLAVIAAVGSAVAGGVFLGNRDSYLGPRFSRSLDESNIMVWMAFGFAADCVSMAIHMSVMLRQHFAEDLAEAERAATAARLTALHGADYDGGAPGLTGRASSGTFTATNPLNAGVGGAGSGGGGGGGRGDKKALLPL